MLRDCLNFIFKFEKAILFTQIDAFVSSIAALRCKKTENIIL